MAMVDCDDSGIVLGTVRENDLPFRRLGNNVGVCHDVAIWVNDEAAAHTLLFIFLNALGKIEQFVEQ